MRMSDVNKTIAIVIVSAGVIVLAYTGKIAEQAVTALLGALIGYVLGNGTGVLEMFARRKADEKNGVIKPPVE